MPETGSPHLPDAKRFLMQVANGEIEPATRMLTPDVTYRAPLRVEGADAFTGRAEVADHLCRFFEQIRGTLDIIEWEEWLVGEHRIGALAVIRMERKHQVTTEEVLFVLRFDRAGTIGGVHVYLEDVERFRRLLA